MINWKETILFIGVNRNIKDLFQSVAKATIFNKIMAMVHFLIPMKSKSRLLEYFKIFIRIEAKIIEYYIEI